MTRKYRRTICIPIKIGTKEGLVVTETKTISASEVAFITTSYLPENSDVSITLLVPTVDKEGKKNIPVSCNAKISSIEPAITEEEPSYAVISFFVGLSADDKKILESLLERH